MTRTKMRELFRSLIDDSGTTPSIFSDTRINIFLYEGALNVQNIIETVDEHAFESELTVDIVAGESSYSLPPDFRKLKEVAKINGTEATRMFFVDTRQRVRFQYDDGTFSLRNNTILFTRPLDAATRMRIVYTKQLEDLTADTQMWDDIPAVARRLVVYEAALIALTAENSKTNDFVGLVADMRNYVIQSMENRADTDSRGVINEA